MNAYPFGRPPGHAHDELREVVVAVIATIGMLVLVLLAFRPEVVGNMLPW